MSVKTLRLNKTEEKELRALLVYTGQDFSECVKELIRERLEDLADLKFIDQIKELNPKDYVSSNDIDNAVSRRTVAHARRSAA